MAEISWIKLKTTMFDDEKIRLIQSMPEADAILVVWIRLLVLAGKTNDEGLIYIQRNMPYSEEMLATLFGKQVSIIRLALTTLEQFQMVDLNNDGTIAVTNWEKHQNIEGMEKVREQNRLRKQKQREKQKILSDDTGQSRDSHATDIDKELDIDKEKDNKENRKPRKRVYEDTSEFKILAIFLYEKINADAKDESEMTKKPDFNSWADDIRKMIEIDKRTGEQVRKMIEWCQSDSFWSSNILSAKKLREKYDTMAKQANSQIKNKVVRQEKLPDWVGNPVPEEKLSAEQQAEADRMIEEMLRRGEG